MKEHQMLCTVSTKAEAQELLGEATKIAEEYGIEPSQKFNKSGSKYLREINLIDGKTDVYAVLKAFNVICPARQHAIKKLLCSGLRGKATEMQDLSEARDAIDRAIQMMESE